MAASSGAAFVHDSSTSAAGSESHTTPPPTQRWIEPSAIANVRIVSASSKSPFPWTVRARPCCAAADRLELRDEIDGGDLGRTRHRPAREGRLEDVREPGVRPEPSLDGGDHVLDPGELARRHELGPPNGAGAHTRERSLRSRSTIITCSAASFSTRVAPRLAERPRPLDRHRPDPVAASGEEELGRSGDDGPAVGDERIAMQRPKRRESRGERPRIAGEGRPQVLYEIDLIHVAPRDGVAHVLDCLAILGGRPGLLPRADLEALVRLSDEGVVVAHHARGERERRARLRRRRGCASAERPRESVAEKEVGDEELTSWYEEAAIAQPRLEPRERVLGVAQFEELNHQRPSSRARGRTLPDRRSRTRHCPRRGDPHRLGARRRSSCG